MKRYFEFSDSKSHKFWQIAVDGSNCTVSYGKIGTAGQEKVSSYDSPERALKEAEKLIGEKTRKGYVEKESASEKKHARRIVVSYDEAEAGKTLLEKVQAFVDSPQAAEVSALVIGAWETPYEQDPQAGLDYLCEHSARLPNLKELFVGDMDSEECEISWIIQGDYTRLFAAFPQLERLHIKGSTGLVLSQQPLEHAHLKALTIECGGLPQSIIQTITGARLPNLEFLNLYLGVEDYGFNAALEDLQPFMDGTLFPRLKYLALADSELADQIAEAIAEAPVLDSIETLDLSKGTLSDKGAEALLASSKIRRLQRLDLHYHYLSNEMMARLKKELDLVLDVSEQQAPDEDEDEDCCWRYPAVTE
ncbi:STM4015 family protein [Azovibrio restrictus]|uniref:STM4015 family protein n=1 Tax=Azovibrio restrictus TaxID=146938 RepID=UPI0004128474|nr:STM4015 family protein [Azovibrio restrictus]